MNVVICKWPYNSTWCEKQNSNQEDSFSINQTVNSYKSTVNNFNNYKLTFGIVRITPLYSTPSYRWYFRTALMVGNFLKYFFSVLCKKDILTS